MRHRRRSEVTRERERGRPLQQQCRRAGAPVNAVRQAADEILSRERASRKSRWSVHSSDAAAPEEPETHAPWCTVQSTPSGAQPARHPCGVAGLCTTWTWLLTVWSPQHRVRARRSAGRTRARSQGATATHCARAPARNSVGCLVTHVLASDGAACIAAADAAVCAACDGVVPGPMQRPSSYVRSS